MRHGTVARYIHGKCHCARCRSAWADYHRKWMHAHPEQQEKHRKRERERPRG